ncbi:glycosyltransferase [Amphritea sp. 1_MG-2023]|uniref:glycosyltransferase n=1 Tax=Amphritea sp. 1_MG-2023 TaxID=3062670 RepID=UPI0026E1DC5B|nr:glycosyltransferase [Amphritea sp. 1_MG-2023]MDO6565141.1 glycosyltransferase [Amphritea sp. 1_MG-2023]
MTKIAFLMRYDFEEKGGGDVVQVKSYIPYLQSKGFTCALVDELNSENINEFDIFILVNIDRPVETVNYFDFIIKNAPTKKMFIIPIHHPIDAINRFEKQKSMLFKVLTLLRPDFYSREKIKNFIRGGKYLKMMPIAFKHIFVKYRKKISEILNRVDGVIYISNGERKSVEVDFDFVSSKYCIAYNAVSISNNIEINKDDRPFDVAIVGRVEPRKNQLKSAVALSKTNLKVIFIGPLNSNDDKYGIEFKKIVGKSKKLEYLGNMEHSKVLEYLTQSKILLNASYFEVNPLVDLEAALCGCGVVTTKFSYSKESLPNVIEVDPWDDESIKSGVIKALKIPDITIKDSYINSSWDDSAEQIYKLIKE